MYRFVFVAKYRRLVINEEVDTYIKNGCVNTSKRYEIRFLEIGTEGDHVNFLIQSVPMYSSTKIAVKEKILTAKNILSKFPKVKEELWSGEFWSDNFYVSTIGEHANKTVIREYIKNQGEHGKYKQLHKEKLSNRQLSLFNH